MGQTNSVNTNAPPSAVSIDTMSASSAPSAVVGLSPEMLLEYCGSMLNGLSSQIDDLMNQQKAQINEQQVLGTLQNTLGQIASPPANQSDMNSCVAAYQTAINALPAGDPVATELQSQLSSFQGKYVGAGTVTADGLKNALKDNPFDPGKVASNAVTDSATYPSASQWQAITGQLGTIANNIQSGAKIQFLQLQDLFSQQQDAVEQATNMMTKEDQTLLDQAKAVGA